MTTEDFNALVEFNAHSVADLNAGLGGAIDRKDARCRLRQVAPIRNRLKLADLNELESRIALVSSRWLSSDLYDRCGFYRAAAHCLREGERVKAMFDAARPPSNRNEYNLVWSLHMFRILESVSKHRKGDRGAAAEICESLQKKLEELLHHARKTGEQDPVVLFWLDQLGWRTSYAAGRHFLSDGFVTKAELAFGKALEFCSESRKRCENNDPGKTDSTDAQHILFWTATTLSALARAAMEQGRLERAMRQLHVARTMLCNTKDRIGVAFVDSLLGGIYRQRGDEGKAIDHLQTSLAVFQREWHERYGRRTFYELVKTYINSDRFEEAEAALRRPAMAAGPRLFRSGNRVSRERWEGVNSLMWARLKLARYDYIGAQSDADRCLAQLKDHSEDIRVQAYAVQGEAALSQRKYSEAIRKSHAGLTLNPIDPTDRAWLILVLCEAYLRRKHIENAKHWFGEWSQLRERVESRLFTRRAANLEHELDAECDSFYICYREPRELKFDVLSLQLRAFLVRHVRTFKRGATQEEQARALGISRQTYASWLAELRKENLIDD